MKTAYIDTDVIIDLLQQRKGFFNDAAQLFTLIEKVKIRGFVSPVALSSLYYIL